MREMLLGILGCLRRRHAAEDDFDVDSQGENIATAALGVEGEDVISSLKGIGLPEFGTQEGSLSALWPASPLTPDCEAQIQASFLHGPLSYGKYEGLYDNRAAALGTGFSSFTLSTIFEDYPDDGLGGPCPQPLPFDPAAAAAAAGCIERAAAPAVAFGGGCLPGHHHDAALNGCFIPPNSSCDNGLAAGCSNSSSGASSSFSSNSGGNNSNNSFGGCVQPWGFMSTNTLYFTSSAANGQSGAVHNGLNGLAHHHLTGGYTAPAAGTTFIGSTVPRVGEVPFGTHGPPHLGYTPPTMLNDPRLFTVLSTSHLSTVFEDEAGEGLCCASSSNFEGAAELGWCSDGCYGCSASKDSRPAPDLLRGLSADTLSCGSTVGGGAGGGGAGACSSASAAAAAAAGSTAAASGGRGTQYGMQCGTTRAPPTKVAGGSLAVWYF